MQHLLTGNDLSDGARLQNMKKGTNPTRMTQTARIVTWFLMLVPPGHCSRPERAVPM